MADLPATGPDRAFQEHIADGRLWLQSCDDCHRAVFMPRLLCPACGSASLTWTASPGTGTVHSRAVIHRRPKPGDSATDRHALVLVDLDEGARMMSRLPALDPEEIRPGMRVRARIEGEDGARTVVFDPA